MGYAEYACAAFVTVGCAGEYIAEFTDWLTGGVKERKERLAKRSTLLLIVALSFELICLVKTNQLSGEVIGSLNELAGQADTKARQALGGSAVAIAQSKKAVDVSGQATTSASNALVLARGARQEADTFEKRLGGAEHKADEADSHVSEALRRVIDTTAELDRIKMPRSISDRAGLVAALKSFSGTEFAFGSVFGDDESFQLLRQLDQVFAEAGWHRVKKTVLNIGIPALTITGKDDLVDLGTNTGVRVEVEAPDITNIETLAVDKLPPHIRLALTLNGVLFAHIIPSEIFTPAARVNAVSGSSKVIRVKVGKKP